MSSPGGNWGFLVSGLSGDFLGGESLLTPRLWFTTWAWLFRSLCLLAVSWVSLSPYLYRQDLSLWAKGEGIEDHIHWCHIFNSPIPSVFPACFQSSRDYSTCPHRPPTPGPITSISKVPKWEKRVPIFFIYKWRTIKKDWFKPGVWNFSLHDNHLGGWLQHDCWASSWVPAKYRTNNLDF